MEAGEVNDTMSEEAARVWFVYPDGDPYQHGTTTCPPHDGGQVRTLCHTTVEAPPAARIRLHPFRPFCRECLMGFLNMPRPPIAIWVY